MNNSKSAISNYERYRRARAKLAAGNKRAIFKGLAEAKITEVRVAFDGEGDSGQIETITAFLDNERVNLPTTTIPFRQVPRTGTRPVTVLELPSEAIEALCYDYLEDSHGGWENNDGAFGEFRLCVSRRTIELLFNARFTDTFTSNHTF
jgi:hypothetical protein